MQFSFADCHFEIKNPETGSVIPVQLDNLDKFSYNAENQVTKTQSAIVEMAAHPLFWHDSNQYLIVRDEKDQVNLTRVKV